MFSDITFSVVTVNGLIDSFNPCAIGVLVATIAILFSLGGTRRQVMLFGFFYVLTTYVTYLLIGLGILKAVHFFGIHNFFAWASSVFLIFMGLWQYKRSMCIIPKKRAQEATVLTAILLGFLVGLCEFPCSGGIYLATVGLVGLRETFFQGMLYLLWYNFLFVLPLIVIFGVAYNKYVANLLAVMAGKYGEKARKAGAIGMVLMGLLLILWLVL
jgi:cytochrome c-type biogenesis protein